MTQLDRRSTAYRIEHFVPRERIPELRMVVQEIIDTLPGLTARQLYARTVQLIHGNKYKQRVNTLLGGEYYLPTNLDVGGRNSLVRLLLGETESNNLELGIKFIETSFGVTYHNLASVEALETKIAKAKKDVTTGKTPETSEDIYKKFREYYEKRVDKCPNKEWKKILIDNLATEKDIITGDGKVRLTPQYTGRLTRITEDDILGLIYDIVQIFNSNQG